jgi:hypothetical protein
MLNASGARWLSASVSAVKPRKYNTNGWLWCVFSALVFLLNFYGME